jgi:very-short-patch-repair endonuclease
MRDKPIDSTVAELAERQHGVVSAAQLREAGIGKDAIRRRVHAGRLHRIHRGVYAVGHRRLTYEGRCAAAVLACGRRAAVSHHSAAVLWRMLHPSHLPIAVTVATAGGRPTRPGIELHSSEGLDRSTVTRRQGIPVTRPARTVRDLKRTGPRSLYLRVMRRAIDLRLIEPPVTAADELTRSELERAFLALCRRHRLPPPEINARAGPFEVDFLWRDAGLVVETDGFAFHSDRDAFEADRARDAHLQALGFRVLRFTYRQVVEEPAEVARAVRRVMGQPAP